MDCLFCRADAEKSRSVEHIIPESLGNTKHVLNRGIVCDKCNNYFSRKVEKPFLDLPAIRYLRFHEGLESKRGRVPSVNGVLSPQIPVEVTRHMRRGFTSVQIPDDAIQEVRQMRSGTLLISTGSRLPEGPIVSRFFAKIALEAMALRVSSYPEGLAYLSAEPQLDTLRNHARLGHIESWPVNVRSIYGPDSKVTSHEGNPEQVMHEHDFLVTDQQEWYFVIAIFGVEFVINLAGPYIDGYLQWLEQNGGVSPLYRPKHGGILAMPR